MGYSPWFFQKMAPKSPKFLLHFLIHIDVNMLHSKFELIPTSIFRVMVILRNFKILKNTQGYSLGYFQIVAHFLKWP